MNLKLNVNRNFFTECCCYFCICWIWTCDTSSRGWTLTSHNDQSSGNCLRLSVVCTTLYLKDTQTDRCSSDILLPPALLWPQYIVKGVIIFTKYFYDFTTFTARASWFLFSRGENFQFHEKKNFKWIFQFLISYLFPSCRK